MSISNEETGTQPSTARPGGGFLVAPAPRGGIFSREQFDENVQLFVDTADKFWRDEVLTRLDKIEHKGTEVVDGKEIPVGVMLLRKAGELGLLAVDLPEEYGGLGQSKSAALRVVECFAGCASQAATIGAHGGIGTLPIAYFGTAEQKQRLLPKLATAEYVGCYCLTEPGAGSDALSGRTTATPVDGGAAFLINGAKQYITNGAWADTAVVFAGVKGKYSAFIVDLHSPGVTRGPEEKKMGIRGSSTTPVIFEDVRVPKDNLLGDIGDAANIALNILYVGRMKLGFASMGSAKYAIDLTVKFGNQRKQFSQPVISFEMQKAKLAGMVASVYALDSLCYRVCGDVDAALAKLDHAAPDYDARMIKAIRPFGVEAAIIKIAGSEVLMQVANSAVRMHGGYGFTEEYHVERVVRDNVIDTIFEGTNDINRAVIFGNLVQSIMGAEMPFRETLEQLHAEMRHGRYAVPAAEGPLAAEYNLVEQAKRALAYTVEQTIIGLGKDVRVEQQPGAAIADALIALYGAESTLARICGTLPNADARKAETLRSVAALVVHAACEDIRRQTLETLAHVVPAELSVKRPELLKLLAPLDSTVDVMAHRRAVADYTIETGRYPF